MSVPSAPEISPSKGAVVITGASTGIGHATALLLDRSGYQVFASIRKPDDADRLAHEGSSRLCPLFLDITDQAQVAAAAALVTDKLGPERGLLALINNAGICEPGPIEFIRLDRLRHQLDVNFIGHVAVIQAFMPLVRKGPGRIINVASAMGEFPFPLLGAYAASKRAMSAMNDALRRELRWWRIPVSLVIPGTVESPIWDTTPRWRYDLAEGPPEDKGRLYQEMARAVAALMDQGRRAAVTPDVIADVIKQALEARRPKVRYRCGPGSRMSDLGTRLPQAFTDWIVAGVLRKRLPSRLVGW